MGKTFYQSLINNNRKLEVLSAKLLIEGSLSRGVLGSFDAGDIAIQGLAWAA